MFDLSHLGNGKFFAGNFKKFENSRGWFIGKFMPDDSPLKTEKLEVLYKEHKQGDIQPAHYHKEKVELLLFIKGKAKYMINNQEVILNAGDFLFVDVNNTISGEFIEDSIIFALHTPSIPEDKYE